MHLTNHLMSTADTANDDFDIDYQKQRSLGDLFEYLKAKKENVSSLWQEIQVIKSLVDQQRQIVSLSCVCQNVVIKTIFLGTPHLVSAYGQCRPGSSLKNSSPWTSSLEQRCIVGDARQMALVR